jgi:MFS family permease
VGVILGALLTAPLVDRVGVERVLTCVLALGALCVLSIGLLNPLLLVVHTSQGTAMAEKPARTISF